MPNTKQIAGCLAALILASGTWLGCDDRVDQPQPLDRLHFPSDMAIGGPDGGVLYIVGSNFDRRYDGGALQAVDLVQLDAAVDAADPPLPLRLPELPWLGGVNIGSFGGRIALAELEEGGERLFVPLRGEGALAIVDSEEGELACYPNGGTDCRPNPLPLTTPSGLPVPDPFASAIMGDRVFIASLRDQTVDEIEGTLSAYTASIFVHDPDEALVRPIGGFLTRDLVAAPDGIHLFAVGSSTSTTGVGSITGGEIRSFPAVSFEEEPLPVQARSLTTLVGSNDGRAMAFSSDGGLALALTRSPSALLVFDMEDGGAGALSARSVIPLPESPSRLALIEQDGARLVAITALDADALVIVDLDLEQVVAVLDGTACDELGEPCPEGSTSTGSRDPATDMGIQPWALVTVPRAGGGARVWVASFADATLRAVDIPDLQSPWEARVVAVAGGIEEEETE